MADQHPCTRGDGGKSCERVRHGEPYSLDQCRLCWLSHHAPAYNLAWGGDGNVSPVASADLPQRSADLQKFGARLESKPTDPPKLLERGPDWFHKLVNFSKAAVQHAWNGLPETPTPEQERRLTLCLSCERLDAENGTCKHPNCGCNLLRKTAWADQHCPIGKW